MYLNVFTRFVIPKVLNKYVSSAAKPFLEAADDTSRPPSHRRITNVETSPGNTYVHRNIISLTHANTHTHTQTHTQSHALFVYLQVFLYVLNVFCCFRMFFLCFYVILCVFYVFRCFYVLCVFRCFYLVCFMISGVVACFLLFLYALYSLFIYSYRFKRIT